MDSMEIRSRYRRVWDELSRDKTMVLMAGPRQAGKTTLAKQLAEGFSNSLYFNWDIVSDRQKLLAHPTFFTELERRDSSIPLVIFDEIHKYRDWKNYLKGVVDEFGGRYRFLVSGSGRLEIYQKGGDSLAGRYLPMHLWPLTLAELSNASVSYEEFSAAPPGAIVH